MRQWRETRNSDLASLQMENELLSHETSFLRAQLKQAERRAGGAGQMGRLTAQLGRCRAQLEKEREKRKALRAELKKARRQLSSSEPALEDLRWLLARLDSSPAAPLLRRKAGFRTLCEKYGI